MLIPGKVGHPRPAEQIQGIVKSTVTAQKRFAGQQVVAHRRLIIGKFPFFVGQQLHTGIERFKAGFVRLGAAHHGLKEHIFRQVIIQPHTQHRLGTEVFDGDQPGVEAGLEIFRIDIRFLDAASFDPRIQY